jgi:hypothetical protein
VRSLHEPHISTPNGNTSDALVQAVLGEPQERNESEAPPDVDA